MLGPSSQTFKQVKKEFPEVEEDEDEWKYVTLFTKDNITYDFRIRLRNDVINFIIAVSNSAMGLNPDYFGFTSKETISMIMIKQKLKRIAANKGITVD